MIYRRTVGFKREFASLPSELQRVARTKFSLFSKNWRHPSLRVHKLEGVLWHDRQVFDLYLNAKYRVLFVVDHDVVVSFSVGPHSIVSK